MAEVQPAEPLVPASDPLAPGLKTTEGKAALYALILTGLAAVVPPLWTALSNLSAIWPEVHYLAAAVSVVGVIGGVLVTLGYGKQRATIKAAALAAPVKVIVSAEQRGFARLAIMLGLLVLLTVVAGCASFSKVNGSTGPVDLGKGVTCSITVGVTDLTACTKASSQVCEFPLPRDAAGACLLDASKLDIPFSPGTGWKCVTSAAPGATPCTKMIATNCATAVPRDAAGACP
ncbi:MAG: hypothetical protein M3P32_07410 [Chloroflexota bacterium]|nr:hypothetical protein [Chloroflexota bacterium]